VLASTDEGTVVAIEGANGLAWTFMVTNGAADPKAEHRIEAEGKTYTWTGHAALRRH
jgi:hypothetical protein